VPNISCVFIVFWLFPQVARGKTEYCAAHGGGIRCSSKGCYKIAVSGTNLCRLHGVPEGSDVVGGIRTGNFALPGVPVNPMYVESSRDNFSMNFNMEYSMDMSRSTSSSNMQIANGTSGSNNNLSSYGSKSNSTTTFNQPQNQRTSSGNRNNNSSSNDYADIDSRITEKSIIFHAS
jgi:hypothetical protein